MNVFEDLIEELREENLLEETIIDLRKTADPQNGASALVENGGMVVERSGDDESGPAGGDDDVVERSEPVDEREFYRKRAMDEISSLQMVEHVLSGIEREHMKVVPATYDDLGAKKALHRFVQVQGEVGSDEYAEAEFHLMRETEAWSTALAERDKKISVSNLRRFCENSRPVLSSQALMALSRFYRNSAFTELSRAKFDLVMTRLFSRETEAEQRRLLFSRVDMVGHIKTLYANWSSVAVYSADDASLKTRAVVAGFDDRVKEAENADTFEALIKNSFFDKVHEFKEATGEMFYTPEVVAASIDCNIRIGNRFIDLIRVEREHSGLETVERKYGYEYDQIISDAAGKTLHLVEVLKSLPDDDAPESRPAPLTTEKRVVVATKDEKASGGVSELFKVNKWLLAVTLLVILSSTGLFFWANQPTEESSLAEKANSVEISTPELSQYLRNGRSTAETFYAITLPAWSELSDEKKKEVLGKTQEFARTKNLKSVRLINVRGDLEAYGTESRSEILKPIP